MSNRDLENLNAAITLLLQLTAAAGRVSTLIAGARADGRGLNSAELHALEEVDDTARAGLVAAIDAARAGASS